MLWAEQHEVPYTVLGRGSNVLVGDLGFDGLVVRNARSTRFELLPGRRVRAESGVEIGSLITATVGVGWSGLEHFAGIPSTLGGGLWQNLHFLAPDRRELVFLGDVVESATVVSACGVRQVGPDWFRFGYDRSALHGGGTVVLDAIPRLGAGDPEALRRVVRANLAWRADRHPARAAHRSAGCVFRNPPGASAARTIDAARLKGLRVGGAVVSRRHANFVLNTGGATANDVCTLLDSVAERVLACSGLLLEPELAFVGDGFPYRWLAGSASAPAA